MCFFSCSTCKFICTILFSVGIPGWWRIQRSLAAHHSSFGRKSIRCHQCWSIVGAEELRAFRWVLFAFAPFPHPSNIGSKGRTRKIRLFFFHFHMERTHAPASVRQTNAIALCFPFFAVRPLPFIQIWRATVWPKLQMVRSKCYWI